LLVKLANVVGGRRDRIENLVVDLFVGALGEISHIDVANLDVVELGGQLAEGHVTFLTDAGNDIRGVASCGIDPGVALEECNALVGREIRNDSVVHTSASDGC
jgi:hypothetical protein